MERLFATPATRPIFPASIDISDPFGGMILAFPDFLRIFLTVAIQQIAWPWWNYPLLALRVRSLPAWAGRELKAGVLIHPSQF
jgi:hypothetical protein